MSKWDMDKKNMFDCEMCGIVAYCNIYINI